MSYAVIPHLAGKSVNPSATVGVCTLGKHRPAGKSCIITSNEAVSVTYGGLITSVTVGETQRDGKCALGCSAYFRGKRECFSQAILGKIDRKAKVTVWNTGQSLNEVGVAGMVSARQAAKWQQTGGLSVCPGRVSAPVLQLTRTWAFPCFPAHLLRAL